MAHAVHAAHLGGTQGPVLRVHARKQDVLRGESGDQITHGLNKLGAGQGKQQPPLAAPFELRGSLTPGIFMRHSTTFCFLASRTPFTGTIAVLLRSGIPWLLSYVLKRVRVRRARVCEGLALHSTAYQGAD